VEGRFSRADFGKALICINQVRYAFATEFNRTNPMKWFPQEKHRIDFLGLATRKEKNPWMEKFYVVFGLCFFAYVFYGIFFGD
jgi:hypothetical protein